MQHLVEVEPHAEPLALRSLLRNPGLPATHARTEHQAAVAVDVSDLRRKYRKSMSDERAKRRKAAFVEAARNSPEALYDRLTAAKSGVDLAAPIAEIAALQRDRALTYLGGDFGSIVIPQPPAGQGEMWWGETSYATPSRIGMYGMFNEMGLLLFGNLSWDDGDLYQTGFHIYSSFYLSPERMPAANFVRSSPGGVLAGQMLGSTSGAASFFLGGFAEGDHWSKCTLKLYQRAFAIHPHNPADVIPAAPQGAAQFSIIDIEDTHEFAEATLPGGLAYPAIDIHLIKDRILRIDLEIDLFIQLEGDASIRFGGVGHGNPAFHQWSQWKLQPL